MLQVVQNFKTGELALKEVPEPALKPGGILVMNDYSLISVGTERLAVTTAQKNLLGKAQSRPDLVEKVKQSIKRDGFLHTIELVRNKLDAPLALGYSSAGTVIGVAEDVNEFSVGDHVACAGQGYASHAEINFIPKNLAVKVPDHVPLDEAAFTTLGAIAMQGIRQAEIVVGDKVAVIGLGLLGLLTVQIAKASGCTVLGMDIKKNLCEVAEVLGVNDTTISSHQLLTKTDMITDGYGVDKVIITASTSSHEPIRTAGEILRKKGILVVVGMVPTDIPRSLFYEKEIDVKYSCSYGPGRYDTLYEEKGLDYPYGYVRWTENRNMQSFLGLIADKRIRIDELITHRFPIQKAEEAYHLITGQSKRKEKLIGIILEYTKRNRPDDNRVVVLQNKNLKQSIDQEVGIGFIGAGNFAQGFLIPALRKNKDISLIGVSTSRGVTGRAVAEKFGFEFATTDNQQILNHESIQSIFITTRHNSHAEYVIETLKCNKSIYVEKPLALNQNQLKEIIKYHKKQSGLVMVGFNRRFSSHILKTKRFFSDRESMLVSYRINAGYIPKDHWTQDPDEGGGRIIGEVCHFIDLINVLVGSNPIRVFAESLSPSEKKDTVCISLKYRNGSVGNIVYSAVGDKSFPKERIEIFSKDLVAVIDDFRKSIFIQKGKMSRFKSAKQDKGHQESVNRFIESVKKGKSSPIPFEDSVKTTMITFKIVESLSKGEPIDFKF